MNSYDVCVVGAGLTGVFAARALMRKKLSVCVLESGSDVCTGISRSNAAIVYSGYDVTPGTLKAALCIPAAESFPSLCEELGVRFRSCGSLLVCFGEVGERFVREKYEQGLQNGVRSLRLLTGAEARELEPALRGDVRLALCAPTAGSVIPWELGIAAYENARANGADFFFDTKVLSLSREAEGYLLSTSRGSFRSGSVINCAGAGAVELRDTLLPHAVSVRPSVSELAVFDEAAGAAVSHVVLTQNEDGTKGITLVPTPDGKLLVENPDKHPASVLAARSTPEGQRKLLASLAELLPGFHREPLRFFSALRLNCFDPSGRADHVGSFSVLEEDGLWSVIALKTPGMTCAEGLGRLLSDQVSSYLGKTEDAPSFDPRRIPPVRVHTLSESERAELIRKAPLYGHILCRCGDVSEGEVLDAIRAGARTLDGIKRRCGSSLGACQGEFCTAKLAKLLARETHQSVEEVLMRRD